MLPIVQRELLVASRKWPTFWSRVIAAVIAFLFVVATVGITPLASGGAGTGRVLFHWLSGLGYWICLFGGVLLTADCLSVERREGTLGLLFLTDLKGYDVVLGKLVAKSLSAVFCLLAIVPMLGIPILLGGVTPGEFWRTVLVLLNTLLFSLSIGMLVSVFCKDARNVFAIAVFFVFLVCVTPLSGQTGGLQVLHPRTAFRLSAAAPYASSPATYINSVLATHAIAWMLLGIASWRVSQSWQTRPAHGRWPGWPHWRRRLLQGSPLVRLRHRQRLLNVNPILWLHSREWLVRVALTVFVLLLAAGCFALNFVRVFHWSDIGAGMACLIFLHGILLMLIAFEAGCHLVDTRREGGIELVLSTRLTVRDILHGHLLTTRRMFAPAIAIILVYDLLWILFATAYARPGKAGLALAFGLCMMVTLAVNAYALVWCALFCGLRVRRPMHAALLAFGKIVVAPLLWFGLVLLGGVQHGSGAMALALFTVLNLVNAWIFATGAHERLHQEFRPAITEHLPATIKDYDIDYALLK